MALHGIGEAGAKKYIEAREAGKLTQKQTDKILSCTNIFYDIFPFKTKYGDMYENPAKFGIMADKIWTIEEIVNGPEIPHGEVRVLMGEVIYKNSRDGNEEINVKKRGGEVWKGQTLYADMRLRDDTGSMGARIGRYDWQSFKDGSPGGKHFIESINEGTHLLVRAKFFNGIKYAFISKMKVLS